MSDSQQYLHTNTYLDRILVRTAADLEVRQREMPFKQLKQRVMSRTDKPLDFAGALRQDTVALIAEIKKASPSKGVLIENFDPATLSKIYRENGAAALSVLTDEPFFQGSLDYLKAAIPDGDPSPVPRLRKDFIVAPYQVYEARLYGADAVLLITAALTDALLSNLRELAESLGMTALVEVHSREELSRALDSGAKVIGINNRNLRTFEVDLNTSETLAQSVPDDVVLVAESGISTAEDVRRMANCGAHAVLVGEALVRADDIAAKVRELSSQSRVRG